MYWSIAAHPLLVLCVTTMFSVQVVTADYQLEVRLVSYRNPDHRKSDGSPCDKILASSEEDPCDNSFSFEIKTVDNGWEQPQEIGRYRNNDNITFGDTLRGGRANPLVFTGVRWNDVRLRVTVCDLDDNGCEDVLNEVRTIELRQETTRIRIDSTTRSGGYSPTLQLSYQVICLPDYYGSECSVYCVPRDNSIGHYTCDESDGTKICLPDYYGPRCSVYCVPRDDSIGHFTCDESDGSKICLPDYYGPKCSIYCVPRNNSRSHFTCDESDGTKICMPGFGGENCTMAQTTDGQEHSQSTSGVGVAVGGAVAGVSVLVVLILLTITAVWVARKKYHKERVISTETEEPRCKGTNNPTYISRDIPTGRLAVRQDSSTRELINPIYGSDGKAEEVPTSSDTKRFEATYSLCGPEADSITDGGSCGNANGLDTSREYDYVAVPRRPANYEVPVEQKAAPRYSPTVDNAHV